MGCVGNMRSFPRGGLVSRVDKRLSNLSTDEVLERIQQQMAEVMISAQETANNAITNETDARVMSVTGG